ncbi:hypothetical protein [Sphingobium boeckii]|uniref:Phasin protein n=1 Tax=Sphingobium boeckii TaxID=1082345 RepID=A0A7W9AEU2_9SPHN|nr:hypothetical protein [Sphingobium boeckii]MBB5684144.1 hypothetical protein [Sphingobium boeckii]
MTASPFDMWTRMMTAGLDMAATGQRMNETLVAAGSVVRHRGETIDAAMRNPLTADHAELGLMMSEKTEAFASAGMAMATDIMKLQMDMFAQAGAVAAVMATGRLPSSQTANAIAQRSERILVRAMGSGGRALAPIHAKATANAKRLAKRKPR